jgi:SRSO17 transposase
VAATFQDFWWRFAPHFGYPQTQHRCAQYLRGLLVQDAERRNAENLAEAVEGGSARAFQRFLTASPWDRTRVISELHAYLGPRLTADDGVFVIDDTGFAKQGTKSVGVARQYSGTLGKVGNCQIGVFLAYASARGHALIDMRLYLPEPWTADPARCRAAGVPAAVVFQTKPELAQAMLAQAKERGHLQSRWVTADAGFGEIPRFRDGLDAAGWWYVVEVPRTTRVFPQQSQTAVPPWSGRGRKPTHPRLLPGEAPAETVEALAAGLEPRAWQTLTVADGAQGPRTYQFVAQRVWECRDDIPGREGWLVLRRNLDGSELKYYLSNAPPATPLPTLGRVGALRWPIETEFEQGKQYAGLDEYEVRSWPGWEHHITLALLAGAFLLSLEQDWGENDARADPPPGEPSAAGTAAEAGVDPGGPLALVTRHPDPQRAGQTLPRQTPGEAA